MTSPSARRQPPILLLGASGFFGAALMRAFSSRDLIATYASHPVERGVQFDVRRDTPMALLARLPERPAVGVIVFGVTGIDACARDPIGTAAVNVDGALAVARTLAEAGIKPVFLSSDAVFDGSRGMWREEDAATPILTYGRQKLEVERGIAALPGPWLVVRLPKLLSLARDRRCMLWQWIESLGAPGRILCATDQFFTPAAADDAARAIAALVDRGAEGLFHVGGPERIGRRALLQAVLDAYRAHAEPKCEIVDCALRELPVLEARPLDTSLATDRLDTFGLPLRPATQAARFAVARHFDGACGE